MRLFGPSRTVGQWALWDYGGEVRSCRPAGPGPKVPGEVPSGGLRWGWRSFPKWWCEGQAGTMRATDVGTCLGEETTHKKNIGEINLFFFVLFSLNQVQCIREFFLSLYVKRLRKISIFVVMSSRLWGR